MKNSQENSKSLDQFPVIKTANLASLIRDLFCTRVQRSDFHITVHQ